MTQETETNNELRMPGTVDIVSKINNNDRASAIDDINDLLYAKAADVLGSHKKEVSQSLFNEPPVVEPESNETDNGSD